MTTKSNIAKNISEKLDINAIDSKKLVTSFVSIIKKHVTLKKIKITNFGYFMTHQTTQRVGRNPKTKESYIIYPTKKVSFKASSKVKKILN